MTPEDFCYWLQGYCEIDGKYPDADGWLEIKNHLALVFDKQAPEKETDGQADPLEAVVKRLKRKPCLSDNVDISPLDMLRPIC